MATSRNDDIMNAQEVAAFLGLARNSVYEAAGRNEIPHRRVGRRLIFSRAGLRSWLGGHGLETPRGVAHAVRP